MDVGFVSSFFQESAEDSGKRSGREGWEGALWEVVKGGGGGGCVCMDVGWEVPGKGELRLRRGEGVL